MKSALLLLVCLVCAGANSTSGSYNDSGGSYENDSGGSYEDTTAPTLTPTKTPTKAPTKAPTAPTLTPTKTPTKAPTKAPTDGDTGSYGSTEDTGSYETTATPTPAPATPTPAPATPAPGARKMPEFDAAQAAKDLATYTVVQSTAGVTLPPTKTPTPAPVPEGMYAKTEVVEKAALEAKMTFPFKGDEVRNSPAVKGALIDGMAAAVGVEAGNVQIAAVDGKKLDEGRRLADAEITFIIIADNAADLAALSTDLVAAAAGGSIVANIQKAAAANGVLTAALKAMEPEVIIETPTTTTVKVTVVTIVTGEAPTKAPTKKPDDNMNAGNSVAPAFGSVMAIVVLSMLSAGL